MVNTTTRSLWRNQFSRSCKFPQGNRDLNQELLKKEIWIGTVRIFKHQVKISQESQSVSSLTTALFPSSRQTTSTPSLSQPLLNQSKQSKILRKTQKLVSLSRLIRLKDLFFVLCVVILRTALPTSRMNGLDRFTSSEITAR